MFTNERYSVKNTKANPDFATEHEVFGYVILMVIFTRYVIKYFSLYSVMFQCISFAKLTFYYLKNSSWSSSQASPTTSSSSPRTCT
jgi:hypothetical protein